MAKSIHRGVRVFCGLLLSVSFALTPTAHASAQSPPGEEVIFEDDFNSENGGHDRGVWTDFQKWDVTRPSVDLIGNGGYDIYPGNGIYVDLAGFTNSGGQLTTRASFDLVPGTYVLEFDLGRNWDGTRFPLIVSLGSAYSEQFDETILLAFKRVSRTIVVNAQTNAHLVFDQTGTSNSGHVIDNVKLTRRAGAANHPPIANAGPDVTVNAVGTTATVALNGSASFDPDGDPLFYEWSVAAGSGIVLSNVDQALASGVFPVGEHVVTLTVADGKGGVATDTVTIKVIDATPPVAKATTNLASLWPPNNKMVPVTIFVQAADECTTPAQLFVSCSVSSNQPDNTSGDASLVGDVNGQDGYTAPVPVALTNLGGGLYAATINLRAERIGGIKAGRTYSINVQAIDLYGNVGYASTTVVVPHDKRN